MNNITISAAALAAMTGVLAMAWQTSGPQPMNLRLAQLSQTPGQAPGTNVNPVTPTPGAPAKTAIPEKIGEPVQSGATPSPPTDNLGSKTAPAGELDLKEPSPNATPKGDIAPPPRG